MPQRELARLSGLKSPSHVYLIESGQRVNTSSEILADFATILGFTLDWLILGVGAAPTKEAVCDAVRAAREAWDIAHPEPEPEPDETTPTGVEPPEST